MPRLGGDEVEDSLKIVIPKRGILREESAVSPPAASRFLADKPGFGMTRGGCWCYRLAVIHVLLLLNPRFSCPLSTD
jgi:hypothetical protein